jgi:hypothetical protein
VVELLARDSAAFAGALLPVNARFQDTVVVTARSWGYGEREPLAPCRGSMGYTLKRISLCFMRCSVYGVPAGIPRPLAIDIRKSLSSNPKLVLRVDRRTGERRMAGERPSPKAPLELKPLRPLARLHMRHIPLVTTVD